MLRRSFLGAMLASVAGLFGFRAKAEGTVPPQCHYFPAEDLLQRRLDRIEAMIWETVIRG